jgi:integrase
MKGKVTYQKDRNRWAVSWYWQGKSYTITRYKGELMYHANTAQKLLAQMQGDIENGVFRIEKYTGRSWTEVESYLWEWLAAIENNLAPATYKDYQNSVKNHIVPFFRQRPIYLHEIQYDTLVALQNSIARSPKGKRNVMYALHACLEYAWKSQRIVAVPPFPKVKIIPPAIEWIPEERQMAIIRAIPKEHQPIFWWLKYHYRRPSEAMALYKKDYDEINGTFTIRRSISDRKYVKRTKTTIFLPTLTVDIPGNDIVTES